MSDQLQRLERRLNAVAANVSETVRPALLKSGDELANMMRQLAPRDTGALAESITVTGPGESTPSYSQPGGSRTAKDSEVIVTAGNSAVRYPHLVEYGTAQAPEQPFFWPSFRLLKKRIEGRIKRAIGKAVRDGWKTI